METGLIKTILYIRVALTSERLVSRFFNDNLSFTKTSMSGAILWAVYKFCPVPKISQVMMKRRRRASHLGRFTLSTTAAETFERFSKNRFIVELQQSLKICTLYEDSANF